MAEPYDGKKILVVDDDPDILTAIETTFREAGAEMYTAADGNTAVTLATEHEPDVMILDAMLPKRSGFLVLEKLKGNKPKGGKPYIIMITANPGKRHQVWAESLGAEGYINKPFAMERLVEAVEKALQKNT